MTDSGVMPSESERAELWAFVQNEIESYWKELSHLPITPELDVERVRSQVSQFHFEKPQPALEVLKFAVQNLRTLQTHYSHPGYLGLFVPQPSSLSVFAEALVAGFNSQLATWHSSPFAVEIEQSLVRQFGARFGFSSEQAAGNFTSGGSEANHTALLAALTAKFPNFPSEGLRSLAGQPVFYVSQEAHHSLHKAAQACGLGRASLREVPVRNREGMDPDQLQALISEDRGKGLLPFLIVGTLGSSSSGALDPLISIAEIAEAEKLWFHLDACYGGAAVILPELSKFFEGAGRADSVALDPHKWLSVSVGTGMFLTRHPQILKECFSVDPAYATKASHHLDVFQPFMSSLSWSRGFTGFKLFLTLATLGWEGYRVLLRRQCQLADELRGRLSGSGWRIENSSPLPVVCFSDATRPDGSSEAFLRRAVEKVGENKHLWISMTKSPKGQPWLRAGIVSAATSSAIIEDFVRQLNKIR